MVKITTATKKILELKKKLRVIGGGTGASKTFSILMVLIDYAQTNQNIKIDVVSESIPHLENGAIRDFKVIMIERKYWRDEAWNDTKHSYHFPNGTELKFTSVDKFGKAHGPRRDVLFLNEGNYLNWDIADQLITRTKKIVFIDFNPVSEFWYHTEIEGKRKDYEYLKLTFLDNEALSDEERAEILAHQHNRGWWTVYGLGELGELENKIYTGWKIIPGVPHEARLERYGLDFGYSNDPTAIVALFYLNGGYIVHEVLFAKGYSNRQLAETFMNLKRALIIADSAEPKSIDEIRSYQLDIQPTQKGKDSVRSQIQLVQDAPMSVTEQSVNIIREYRNYLWTVDRNGKILNEPEHSFSHSMDAIRYAIASLAPVKQQEEFVRHMPRYPQRPQINKAL